MMEDDTKIFGFWVYLMTDLIIFSALFATFIVLRHNTFGGPGGGELFDLRSALKETLILLTSSFTCALATLALHRRQKWWIIFWFAATFALGVSFLYLEFSEFSRFIHLGASWRRSGFLSAFFALVGTHGLHISIGLMWMLVAMLRVYFRKLSPDDISRITRLAYFWHFLDVVWIFIFTVVYAMGQLL